MWPIILVDTNKDKIVLYMYEMEKGSSPHQALLAVKRLLYNLFHACYKRAVLEFIRPYYSVFI